MKGVNMHQYNICASVYIVNDEHCYAQYKPPGDNIYTILCINSIFFFLFIFIFHTVPIKMASQCGTFSPSWCINDNIYDNKFNNTEQGIRSISQRVFGDSEEHDQPLPYKKELYDTSGVNEIHCFETQPIDKGSFAFGNQLSNIFIQEQSNTTRNDASWNGLPGRLRAPNIGSIVGTNCR